MEREKRLIPFSFPSHCPPRASLFVDVSPQSPRDSARQNKKSGLCGEVAVGSSSSSSSSFIHTYSIAIQQQEEKKELKTKLTIH